MYLLYRKKYPHFNMHFLPFQNSLFSQCKKWKIEKIEFFCAYCVHTQNFLWDNSLMLCCSPKNFSWFFETFLVLKFLSQNFFPRKKGWTTEMSEKKKKYMKNGLFSQIGRNMGSIFGGVHFWVLEGTSVKKNYMIWVLNAFCVHQKFVAVILRQHGKRKPSLFGFWQWTSNRSPERVRFVFLFQFFDTLT